jgi:hypothetical protein
MWYQSKIIPIFKKEETCNNYHRITYSIQNTKIMEELLTTEFKILLMSYYLKIQRDLDLGTLMTQCFYNRRVERSEFNKETHFTLFTYINY